MKVHVVGTSCSWFFRNDTSYIIDDSIVFDMPSGSYKDIIKVVNPSAIDSVIISHFHSDHFADLAYLVKYCMSYGDRKSKLKVYGPKGILSKLIERNTIYDLAYDERSEEEIQKAVEFIEVEDGMSFEVGRYKVNAFKMEHGYAPTLGFTFTDSENKTVGFSADTCYCENLEKILSKSNFAFVEMTLLHKSKAHLSAGEFVELTKKFKNTKMFPVHTTDDSQKFAMENGLNYLEDGQDLEL